MNMTQEIMKELDGIDSGANRRQKYKEGCRKAKSRRLENITDR